MPNEPAQPTEGETGGRPARPPLAGRRLWAMRGCSLAIGLAVALLLAEVALRIYPPFELRVQGNRIVLPRNTRQVFRNPYPGRLAREIVQTRNSLGFRGPEPPKDFDGRLTLVTVGGSTTECGFLSDGTTWPDHLARRLAGSFPESWLNNAGLDGHSTFGHLILMREFVAQLRPDVVLFLVGVNDVAAANLNAGDGRLIPSPAALPGWAKAMRRVATYSRLAALLDTWYRFRQAREQGLIVNEITHRDWNENTDNPVFNPTYIEVPEEIRDGLLNEHRAAMLPAYAQRLRELVTICREHGIRPVLITQPALYGEGIDDRTGVDLARVKIFEWKLNGKTKWDELELYNEVTRQVARDEQVLLIDLAKKLPKSTRWFYDYFHYTIEGAEQVAELIWEDLEPWLTREYSEHYRAEAKTAP